MFWFAILIVNALDLFTVSTTNPDVTQDCETPIVSQSGTATLLSALLGVQTAQAAGTTNASNGSGLVDQLRKDAIVNPSTGPISGLPGGGTIPPSRRCARTVWTISDQFGYTFPHDDLASDLCNAISKEPGAKVGPSRNISDPLPNVPINQPAIICLQDGNGHTGHIAWIIMLPITDKFGNIIGYTPGIIGNSQGNIKEKGLPYWKENGYTKYRIITF